MLDLASAQRAKGHEVLVLCFSDEAGGGVLAGAFADAGITVHIVAKRPGLDWTLSVRVAAALRRLQLDVVHTHNSQPLFYAAAAARLSGHVVIHTKHGEGHLVGKRGMFLRRLGSPFVNRFVAVSKKTAEHAREQWAYPFPSQIRVIPNGIRTDVHRPDLEARKAIRRELDIPQTAWMVGTVGRCDANKNQVALIRVLESELDEQMHLVIVGEGERMAELRAAREQSQCTDSIHLLGQRHDVSRVLAALDVFALPSLSEGLPLVILEAMATSVPVVSTAVGGIPKVIVHNENGVLVPSGDETAMSAALAELRNHPERAKSLGWAGQQLVREQYSSGRMADEYLAMYEATLPK